MLRKASFLVSTAASVLITPPVSFAQAASEQEPSSGEQTVAVNEGRTSSSPTQAGLEEIVVTAQRRETVLSRTPVSASAFSGDQLKDVGIGTLDEVAVQTPNFTFVDTGLQPRYRIRGDGLQVFNDTSDSPVGFAVDDVFYGAGAIQRAPLYDVRRVEVLRGPQGTLFGRNTTAGLVQVVTNKPSESFEGYVQGEVGSFDDRQVEAMTSGPLTDSIRGRVALYYDKNDGFQRNIAIPDGDDWSAKDVSSGRGELAVDIGSDATLLLKASHTKDRSLAPMSGTQGALEPGTLAPCSNDRIVANQCVNALGFHATVPSPKHGYSDYDGMPNHLDFDEYTARLDWKLTPSIELVSITGYLDYDRKFQEDADGWSEGGFLGNASVMYTLDAQQFSQELQLRGETEGGVNWVVGGFYWDDERTSTSTVPEWFGDAIDTTADMTTEAEAVFASIEYPLTDTVGLEVGGRYTDETKELDLSFPSDPGASYDVTVDEFTWRAGANWRPIDALYLYATASTGYKSPDFNTTLLFGDASAAAPTDAETSFSLEIGAKWKAFEDRVSVAAAAFHNRIENKQATVVQFQNGIPVTRLFNFGDVDIIGGELELSAKLTDGLSTQLGVSLLDSEIDAPATTVFRSGPASDATPVDGNELTATPHYEFNGLLRYDFGETAIGQFALQGDFSYTAHQYFQLDNNDRDDQDAYGVLNLRAFWHNSDDRFSVQAYVENVTDEEYASYVGTWNGFDTRYIWWGMPRTWGVRTNIRF